MWSHFRWCKCILTFFFLFFQAIFDRNRKDELPGLQLGWIDGICSPLYEVTLQAPPPPVAFTVTQPSSPSVLAVLPQLLSPSLPPADASSETVTDNYSTFLGSLRFLAEKKKKDFLFFHRKLWNDFKVASCSCESECAHFLAARKAQRLRGVWTESRDVSRVKSHHWDGVAPGSAAQWMIGRRRAHSSTARWFSRRHFGSHADGEADFIVRLPPEQMLGSGLLVIFQGINGNPYCVLSSIVMWVCVCVCVCFSMTSRETHPAPPRCRQQRLTYWGDQVC